MPIDIQAPDGTIARFPDGMPDEEILAVMRKHYPPPSNAAAPAAKAAGISFDDLIPAKPQGTGREIKFDDLIPAAARGALAEDPYAAFSSPVAAPGVTFTPVDHDPFAPAPANCIVPAVTSTLRAINEGIPFSDRIVAGAKSLPFVGNSQSYADNLAQEQAAREQLNQAHPLSTAFGRGIGGALTAALPGGVAMRAGLAPALTTGARTGAAYGAAQGVSDQPDLNNAGGDIAGTVKGGLEGGSLGTVFSGLGYGAGKGVSALADWLSNGKPLGNSGAANRLLDAYRADRTARSGAATPDYGPQGMVLDNGPAMLQLAKDMGSTPQGAPIRTAVTARNNSFDRDVSQALPGIIGPDQSALAASTALKAERGAAGRPLQSIFADAPPIMGTTDTLNEIGARLAKLPSGTPEAQALLKVYNYLAPETDIGGGRTMRIAVTDAETLSNAKRAIDGMINFGDPTIGLQPGALASKESSLKMAAGGINQALRDQVPDYGRTMDALASLARQNEGIQYGQRIFDTGKNAVHPDDAALKLSG